MKKSYHSMVVPTRVPARTFRSSRRVSAGIAAADWDMFTPVLGAFARGALPTERTVCVIQIIIADGESISSQFPEAAAAASDSAWTIPDVLYMNTTFDYRTCSKLPDRDVPHKVMSRPTPRLRKSLRNDGHLATDAHRQPPSTQPPPRCSSISSGAMPSHWYGAKATATGSPLTERSRSSHPVPTRMLANPPSFPSQFWFRWSCPRLVPSCPKCRCQLEEWGHGRGSGAGRGHWMGPDPCNGPDGLGLPAPEGSRGPGPVRRGREVPCRCHAPRRGPARRGPPPGSPGEPARHADLAAHRTDHVLRRHRKRGHGDRPGDQHLPRPGPPRARTSRNPGHGHPRGPRIHGQ